jgi:hypothetical protein
MREIRHRQGAFPSPDLSELGGTEIEEGIEGAHNEGIAGLSGRVRRYGNAKGQAARIVAHAWEQSKSGQGWPERHQKAQNVAAANLDRCGGWLHFRHYLAPDKVKLLRADLCNQHLICPVCAIRRGGKNAAAYMEKIAALDADGITGVDQMVTLTVRNGDDLARTFAHLDKCRRKLTDRMRDARRNQRNTTFSGIIAAVGSYEVTNIGNGWHPHVHIWVRADRLLDAAALSAEWRQITGDSHVVDVTPVYGDRVKAFAEIFKYATKFADMAPAHVWEVWRELKGRRLVFSFGALRGVKVPESLLDEGMSGPFRDFFYRWMAAASATRDLGRAGAYSLAEVAEGVEDAPERAHGAAAP